MSWRMTRSRLKPDRSTNRMIHFNELRQPTLNNRSYRIVEYSILLIMFSLINPMLVLYFRKKVTGVGKTRLPGIAVPKSIPSNMVHMHMRTNDYVYNSQLIGFTASGTACGRIKRVPPVCSSSIIFRILTWPICHELCIASNLVLNALQATPLRNKARNRFGHSPD